MSSSKRFLTQFTRTRLCSQVLQGVLNVDANLRRTSPECFKVLPWSRNWPANSDDAARRRRKQRLLSPRNDTGSKRAVTWFTLQRYWRPSLVGFASVDVTPLGSMRSIQKKKLREWKLEKRHIQKMRKRNGEQQLYETETTTRRLVEIIFCPISCTSLFSYNIFFIKATRKSFFLWDG